MPRGRVYKGLIVKMRLGHFIGMIVTGCAARFKVVLRLVYIEKRFEKESRLIQAEVVENAREQHP